MRRRAAAVAVAIVAGAGCRVDPHEFQQRVFACDTAAPDPACGTDVETDAPMTCFAARQLGASDFCTATCDPAAPPDPTGARDAHTCLRSGIALPSCRPSDDVDATHHACAQHGLACYRTDLLADEGVCTTMNPCSTDLDCHDPVRSVCATTFLASLYASADRIQRDHLFCLQAGCKARGTSCSPGETCLQNIIPAASHPPDICVPNCDSNLRCPPNYLCYRAVSPLAPNVCIPGLLGFTCIDAMDCMVGDCVDNGIGYHVCTTTCASDADCAAFDGVQGKFLCVKNPANPTTPGYCETPDAYRGTICVVDGDCAARNPDEVCARFGAHDTLGTCLLPCAADGRCPQRAGINHTCVPTAIADAPPVCLPGAFGLPCGGDDNCFGDLACYPTTVSGTLRGFPNPPAMGSDGQSPSSPDAIPAKPNICSRPCATTADCHASRWTDANAWCETDLGVCLPALSAGDVCPADEACASGSCVADPTAAMPTKRCAADAAAGGP